MTRPTYVKIDTDALLNNLAVINQSAPKSRVIVMAKANGYGCGIDRLLATLAGKVYAFGVCCLEEAQHLRCLNTKVECILFQGVYSTAEMAQVYAMNLQIVVHQQRQLAWLLANPAPQPVQVWVKVNTGMHRLGFLEQDFPAVMQQLQDCPWVRKPIGVMTHLACADEISNPKNAEQINKYQKLLANYPDTIQSIANSAALLAHPDARADVVRAGIMLYGVSPFMNKSAQELGLQPVMHFCSAVTEIHDYPAHSAVGYGATWESSKPSRIGVVPVGYADGFPRAIKPDTKIWVAGNIVPIVGRISMDMLTIDLTRCKNVQLGDPVELWGEHISVNAIASSANTIGYELITRINNRVIRR